MRKIVQIILSGETYPKLVALCDDNTVWQRNFMAQSGWSQISGTTPMTEQELANAQSLAP